VTNSHSPKVLADLPLGVNYQFPNTSLHAAFGELNITPETDRLDVVLTLLMDPVKEGSQTGVALDGSDSMQPTYGRSWKYSDTWDAAVLDRLIREGKGAMVTRDGESYFEATSGGQEDLVRLGFIVRSQNDVEPVARDVIPFLAEKIDADGGTTAIYWACGAQGDRVEILGDLTADQARSAEYRGPREWGHRTQLLPALRYFVERFSEATWGFYVFITDGRLDDLEAVKRYTAELAGKIQSGEAQPLKCVLIGVGGAVDEQQMMELDDLPDALDLAVDIWDHKIAASMRGLRDIFAEVIEENTIVAPSGRVLDDLSTVVASFADGVPALLKFSLPKTARAFTLEIAGNRLEQRLD
jgi:hypothetical protein